ncbi:unnamed protein product [Miscanthus lutarioriparius]|uniref:Uncharacterized protein n=1 Tax=Miscanthus lutarioriparius TaxID=422564 RepID=A0A811NQ13_9POAL|nr:unnamed protein product [Miscanthus lutarioriparius]
MEPHACAGVAAAAVPAPAARCPLQGGQSRHAHTAGRSGVAWAAGAPARAGMAGIGAARVAGADGAPTGVGMAGNAAPTAPVPRPRWGHWPRPRRVAEAVAGAAEGSGSRQVREDSRLFELTA